MFKSRSELVSELVGAGLGRYAERIGERAQPCLHFADSATTGEPSPGATKLGGSPELSEGMSWPYRPALPHVDAFRAWIRDVRLADCWGTPQPLTFLCTSRSGERGRRLPWPMAAPVAWATVLFLGVGVRMLRSRCRQCPRHLGLYRGR
jgi:hypothetical protein